jgi:hypothetical protein
MLLSLLCLSFEELKEFPPNRDEIYSVAIRALLLKWDSSRSIQRDKSYETLTLKHKERLLAWLAAETFENGKHFMKEAQLARLIEGYLQKVPEVTDPDGRELLRQIETQHGLLVQRAQTIYSFSHLTLQEYFTAQYIVDNVARGSLGRLMVHVGDDRWREVFLLIATMLEDATDFCQKYLSALEKILLQDETLLAMLRWAASKSVDKHTDIEPLAMRAFALYIALSVDRDFALSVDRASAHNIDLNLGLNQIFDRAIVANRAIDFNRAFGLALGREHNRTRRLDSARARDLALALARALILDRTRDSTLELSLLDDLPDSILDITFYLRIWAKETGLIELNQALQTLVIPNENAPEEAWQTLNEQLEKIILAYRGLDAFWILSQEQANVMITFLNATYLLKQCITVAYLPHKEWTKMNFV